MKYIVLSDEKSLADVASNAFRFAGRKSKAKVDAAAKALLDANPHLAHIGSLPPGTPVIVPELPEATPSDRTIAPRLASRVKSATQSLDSAFRTIDAARAALDERRLRTAEAFDSPELRKLAEEDGQIASRLGRLRTAAKEREEKERERIEQERNALEAARKSAAELFAKLGV